MLTIRTTFFSLALISILFSCDPTANKYNLRPEVHQHINEVIEVIESNSVQKDKVDWEKFKEEVLKKASSANSNQESYSAIQFALNQLNDYHSIYTSNDGRTFVGAQHRLCGQGPIKPFTVPNDVGYLSIPGFHLTEKEKVIDFASQIQDSIQAQDSENIRGWIVDLRRCSGGNMWPMMLGISPLLGTKVSGYFSKMKDFDHRKNEIEEWEIENGKWRYNFFFSIELPEPYELKWKGKKIAVLIDMATASAGEAIVVAFRGRDNTRFFGNPTCGLTTANQLFRFSNGDNINLAVSYYADRDGHVYDSSIQPDEVITDQERVVDRAIEWIHKS